MFEGDTKGDNGKNDEQPDDQDMLNKRWPTQ